MEVGLDPVLLATVIGACGAVALDTVGALAARRLGFRYALLVPGSFLIYGVVGYAAGRYARSDLAGAVAGSLVGLVDATLGWWVAWRIGPGRPLDTDSSPAKLIRAGGTTVFVATLLGVAGAAIAARR